MSGNILSGDTEASSPTHLTHAHSQSPHSHRKSRFRKLLLHTEKRAGGGEGGGGVETRQGGINMGQRQKMMQEIFSMRKKHKFLGAKRMMRIGSNKTKTATLSTQGTN